MGKRFNRLERKVEREYEKKGYSKKTSEKWAKATAGKVFREQQARRNHSCAKCGTGHSEGDRIHTCGNCGMPCFR